MIWEKKEIDKELVKELSDSYDLDLLTAAIMARRNITDGDSVKYYLEQDLIFTHSPFLFVEMEDAVNRILQASEENEKVRIFGDRDVDGITSTVLLTETLKELSCDVSWSLPQGDEPYGLTMEGVDSFAEEDGTLIITVDCGISNDAEIAYARTKGIDTIVIDHHIPPEILPQAVAIINPKLEDSGYPFKDLAGCGVTAKCIWALLFSKTAFYNTSFCLVNAKPGNDSVIIEAVKIVNMVETDRITENIIPGMVSIDQTRFYPFIHNQELFVFDAEMQERLLRKAFGKNVDIHVNDLSKEIYKHFPIFEGKSLYLMLEKSRVARYTRTKTTELDVLINLFKHLIQAKEKNLSAKYLNLLDLVAIGTLADLMPLRDENRILVKRGMEIVNRTQRKGLQELFLRQNILSKKISTTDVGWQISPLINATGRMGQPEVAAKLLLSDSTEERKKLAEDVISLNKTRKKQGEQAWSRIMPQAKRSLEELNGNMIIIEDSQIPRGITGIIAARLVNMFHIPSMVIASLEEKYIGSIRSPGSRNVRDLLSNFSDLFIDYGGHDYAAGFSIFPDKLKEFKERITDYIKSAPPMEQHEESVEIDAELPPKYMSPELIKIVERFEPYGEESPPIIFLIKGIKIANIDLVGKKEIQHVKLLLEYGEYKWPGLYWNASEKVEREFSNGDTVDIVFRLSRNYYLNKENLQLTVIDLRRQTK